MAKGKVGPSDKTTDAQVAKRSDLPGRVALNFRVPVGIRRQVKIYAAAQGITMCEVLLKTFREAGILSDEDIHPDL